MLSDIWIILIVYRNIIKTSVSFISFVISLSILTNNLIPSYRRNTNTGSLDCQIFCCKNFTFFDLFCSHNRFASNWNIFFFAVLAGCGDSSEKLTLPEIQKDRTYAFITNQEVDSLDIIDLSSFEKIAQIQVGSRPAGIDTDTENQIVYVSNPESKNISRIDLREKTKTNFSAGNSPLAIALSRDRRFIYVSDWYENRINVIRLDSLTIVDKINVGKSPACLIYTSPSPRDRG